ncbi:polysaccharide pyruvyl transferase CsaB [Methanocaldococcus villosus KIN24-T80]|uniref:Polysaccharide pyruvyl transferase CsaB n=1 Tax=Methanocaldococcus villosus KIN24-T80 TaxID=1069083 RepID=N6VSQ7_9EURY|nr:polysaccharide pyruvyl transferase family protein [Methanocaldococcus villosus]ENN96226.1 polysaccharide pyruvyl transferase CsaB [Methanocaldococcus villosus KIN24-T80]
MYKFYSDVDKALSLVPKDFIYGKKILIIGNYGDGNLGDEAMLKVLYNYLISNGVNLIYVITKNPAFYQRYIKNSRFQPVLATNLLAVLKAFLVCDTIIIGGGSIYSRYSGLGVYIASLLSIFIRLLLNKKILILGIGFSSSTPLLLKFICKYLFKICNFIYVRDSISFKNIRNLGIKKKIIVSKDLVFSSFIQPFDKKLGKKILEKEGIKIDKGKRLVGLALNFSGKKEKDEKIIAIFKEIIPWLIDKYNAEILFFTFCPAFVSKISDTFLFKKIYGELGNKYKKKCHILSYYLPEEVMSIFMNLDLVIGSRFHSMVFAYKVGTPFVGISYEEKCSAFLSEIRKPLINIESLDAKTLKGEISRILGGLKYERTK